VTARDVLGVVVLSVATGALVAVAVSCAGHREPVVCQAAPGGVVEVRVTFDAPADRLSHLALSCPP
jgi:hypothetical protein